MLLRRLTATNMATIGKVFLVLRLATRKIFLEPREFILRARMALWILLISLLARLTSLPRAQRIASFKVRSSPVKGRTETPAELGRAIDSVLALDLLVFRPSCWKRAMVLQRFLGLNGIESQVKFGLQMDKDGTVSGHAWLEHQGRPLLEHETGSYVVTFSLPLGPASSEVLPQVSDTDRLEWHRQ